MKVKRTVVHPRIAVGAQLLKTSMTEGGGLHSSPDEACHPDPHHKETNRLLLLMKADTKANLSAQHKKQNDPAAKQGSIPARQG